MAKNDLNGGTISGYICSEIETKAVGQTSVSTFELISRETRKKDNSYIDVESTYFVEAWGPYSNAVSKYCKQGSEIAFQFKLKQDKWEWEGKQCSKIKLGVTRLIFVNSNAQQQKPAPQQKPVQNFEDENPFSDNDIPF